ncbi:MAG: NUDIX hydrolase [Promethearchaeota archaeon]
MNTGKFTPNLIKEALSKEERREIKNSSLRKAGVLIIIYPNSENSYSLVITKRTKGLKKHSGEPSFPGGRFDPTQDKDIIQTALRESFEEIGIDQNSIEILGLMDDLPTISGFIVTPVVGLIKSGVKLSFKRSKAEVDKIFVIPIEFFLDPKNFRETYSNIDGERFPIYFFDYINEQNEKCEIWGATSHMLVEFLKRVYGYNPSKMELHRFTKDRIEKLLKKRGTVKVILQHDEETKINQK